MAKSPPNGWTWNQWMPIYDYWKDIANLDPALGRYEPPALHKVADEHMEKGVDYCVRRLRGMSRSRYERGGHREVKQRLMDRLAYQYPGVERERLEATAGEMIAQAWHRMLGITVTKKEGN